MIQDFQDNLILTDQIENLSGWITLMCMQMLKFFQLPSTTFLDFNLWQT